MITDFVVELQGSRDSSRIDERDLNLNLNGYLANQKVTNRPRTLKHLGRGASDGDPKLVLVPDLTKRIVAEILRARTGGDTIGAVCISGFSKGSTYALRLAIELFVSSVEVTYVGLADLPLFPFGQEISGFPEMMPSNSPQASVRRADFPPRTIFPPIVDAPEIFAKKRKNYFQNEGNGMEVLRNLTAIAKANGFFWWASNMPNNEIHGMLDGGTWDNLDLNIAPQANDARNHDIGDEQGLKRIAADISLELDLASRRA
jgi:hypothetical protein